MKTIQLTKVLWFDLPLDGQPVDTHEVIATRKQFDQNAKEVIFSALAIEVILKDQITGFFVSNADKEAIFHETISSSDQFTFAAAKKVFHAILKKTSALSEPEIAELNDLLGKVMHYRNAMTHGRIIQETTKLVLHYYQGEPRNDEISDEYWGKLEGRFKRAHELLDKAVSKLKG
ncbi:MAG: hypothetical protein ABSH11_14125 [Verrucomicrobiota bacterium]